MNNDAINEGTAHLDHVDMRKVSQAVYNDLGKASRDASSTTNSPPSHGAFSGVFSHRSISGPEFGNDLTNVGMLFSHGNAESNASTESRICSGPDKTIRRSRQFTPASAKAIDDEDEPRRSSPRGRTGLSEQVVEWN